MGSVPANTGGGGGGGGGRGSGSGSGNRGLAELNYHRRYEHREVRDGVGEGQGLSEEDELKINEIAENINAVGREVVSLQPQISLPKQQQQGSGSVVRWERFLPLRSLKVLLVENDDSTRHVVSALLRNCSYEVVAVANGVQAWKILQDLANHIDIVLTEVVMPCVSGIGLLCKIMNHQTCKNIPVIMMSSHDSMGIVFKCLSKGAVDFLVKPIRKNELKNLWQHVWRRCHSSSGSGSESGIQAHKSVKSKSIDDSDNNSSSNDVDEEGSVGLKSRDGSDNGSGTQSSWTKRAVEVDSPRTLSPWDQSAEPQDSTCAQVIHPKSESFEKEWEPTGAKRECPKHAEQLDNVSMGKDLEIGVPRSAEWQKQYPSENVCANLIGTMKNNLPKLALEEKNHEQSEKRHLEVNVQSGNVTPEALNSNNIIAQVEIGFCETTGGNPKVSEIKVATTSNDKEVPPLQLSLKRLREVGITSHEDRNVLRHSDLSAFSRYNTSYNANQAPTAVVGSCSPLGNSSEAMKTDSLYNNQRSNESSNNCDMGSTTKNAFTNPPTFTDKSGTTSMYPSAFACPPQQVMPQKADDVAVNAPVAQPRAARQQVQVQHHHHYYHHHHHHVHNMKQQQELADTEDLSLSMGGSALQCGSSNMVGGPIEGTTGNYSVNGSASGSNHGSSKDLNVGVINIESDNGVAGKSGVAGNGSGSGSGVDQNRSAQRLAALTKFRQKKKERCFERKVRYQSRKRLAEQRPRVRGQFVRQRVYENTSGFVYIRVRFLR